MDEEVLRPKSRHKNDRRINEVQATVMDDRRRQEWEIKDAPPSPPGEKKKKTPPGSPISLDLCMFM